MTKRHLEMIRKKWRCKLYGLLWNCIYHEFLPTDLAYLDRTVTVPIAATEYLTCMLWIRTNKCHEEMIRKECLKSNVLPQSFSYQENLQTD